MRIGLVSVVLALIAAPAAWAQREYEIPLFLADGDPVRHSFARIINHSDVDGTVSIAAIDDEGVRSEAVTLKLPAKAAVHFNSGDLEKGNPEKGLTGQAGDGSGAWRLQLATELEIEPLAYVRTQDGFLTSLHEVAPAGPYVPILNPGSNFRQRSLLRVINPTESDLTLTMTATDDSGKLSLADDFSSGFVRFEVKAGAARTFTAQELEAGGDGFEGALGDGTGKWQLVFFGDPPVFVMSLLESPTKNLTNLSTFPAYRNRTIPLMLSNRDPDRHGFVRVVNFSDDSGTVYVSAIDDSGREVGPVALPLESRQALHFNSRDLEEGAPHKGFAQGLGTGNGNWRLEFSSSLYINASAFVRTADGFVTSMHDVGRPVARRPGAGSVGSGQSTEPPARWRYHLPTFNPASNTRQRSLLRLVNPSDDDLAVEVEGIDDSGSPAAGKVQLTLAAHESRTLSAQDLERGEGLHGLLGDGVGKWRLYVSADEPLFALSLLESPTGQLTNLSRTYHGGYDRAAHSYKLHGVDRYGAAGTSVAAAGDMDGDGVPELIVGAPAQDSDPGDSGHGGSAHLISGASLPRLDAESEGADGRINLAETPPNPGAWKLVGEAGGSLAGAAVASAGDVDGDGRSELLLGSPGFGSPMDSSGAAYLISWPGLAAADGTDGAQDGVVSLEHIAARHGSWKFIGEAPYDVAGSSVASAGDFNGDGVADLLIGAPGDSGPDDADEEVAAPGAVYLVSGASLSPADRADGQSDGVIELGNIAAQADSWKLVGEHDLSRAGASLASVGDMNDDGLPELLVGAPGYDGEFGASIGAAYLVSPSDLASLDAADGEEDGIIALANVAAQPHSWKLAGKDVEDSEDYRVGHSVSSAGDIDGDGQADLLIGRWDIIFDPGPIYLLAAASLAALDDNDGRRDGTVDLSFVGRERGSWRLDAARSGTYPSAVASAGDVDGDGLSDILIGTRNGGWSKDGSASGGTTRAAFLIAARDLAALDAQDGRSDRRIDLNITVFEAVDSWQFIGEGDDNAGNSVASAGDLDGDGLADVLIGANQAGDVAGAVYVLSTADLPALDWADGYAAGVVELGAVAGKPE